MNTGNPISPIDISSSSLTSGTQVRRLVHKRSTRKKRRMNRLVFTQGWVDRLETPTSRKVYYDLKVKYLLLEAMPTGMKVYRYQRKIKGKNQKATIGRSTEVTLEEARDRAELLSAESIKGADFKQLRQDSKDELTLQELAEFYFDQYAEDRCSTVSDMRKNFSRWFSPELELKVSELDTFCIQTRINKLATGKHYHRANKALDYIKAILNWGVRKRFLKENPALTVDNFQTESRNRIVQPHEFEPLIRAITALTDQRMADFFLTCLYTGARSGKVMSMRWEDLDLNLGLWTIGKDKNGDPNFIGLSEAALDILRRRHRDRGLNPWVFPGGRPHQPTKSHLKEPKKLWKKILQDAGISNLRIHDLRRSLGSYMAMAGENTATIQKTLGHKSIQAAAIYQRVQYLPAKQAADKAIGLMSQMSNQSNRQILSGQESG